MAQALLQAQTLHTAVLGQQEILFGEYTQPMPAVLAFIAGRVCHASAVFSNVS